jgi:hypothetical protein
MEYFFAPFQAEQSLRPCSAVWIPLRIVPNEKSLYKLEKQFSQELFYEVDP